MNTLHSTKGANDASDAIDALEIGVKIIARMIVKAVTAELLTQERTMNHIHDNFAVAISPNNKLSDERGKRLVFSVSEAATLLGISKGTAYTLVQTGQIPSIKWGKRMLIPRVALMKMLEEAGMSKPASMR